MKRTGAVVLVVSVLAFGLTARAAEDDKTVEAIKALDMKLTQAFKDRDVKTLEKSLAEDYTEVDPLGRVHTKKQYLGYLSKGTAKLTEVKETDVKVRVIGHTAVLTGLVHIKGTVQDKDIGGEYRWTRVYHQKKGEEWVCILEQHTYVIPKDAEK